MKMKRNIFSVLIAAVLAVVFAGCSNMVEELKVQDTTTFITPGSYTITDGETANTYTITKTLVTKNGEDVGSVDSNGKITMSVSEDVTYDISVVKDGTLTLLEKSGTTAKTYKGKFLFTGKTNTTLKNTADDSDTIQFTQNAEIAVIPDGTYEIDGTDYTISGSAVTKVSDGSGAGSVGSDGIVTVNKSDSETIKITVFDDLSVEALKTTTADGETTKKFYKGAFNSSGVATLTNVDDDSDTLVIKKIASANNGTGENEEQGAGMKASVPGGISVAYAYSVLLHHPVTDKWVVWADQSGVAPKGQIRFSIDPEHFKDKPGYDEGFKVKLSVCEDYAVGSAIRKINQVDAWDKALYYYAGDEIFGWDELNKTLPLTQSRTESLPKLTVNIAVSDGTAVNGMYASWGVKVSDGSPSGSICNFWDRIPVSSENTIELSSLIFFNTTENIDYENRSTTYELSPLDMDTAQPKLVLSLINPPSTYSLDYAFYMQKEGTGNWYDGSDYYSETPVDITWDGTSDATLTVTVKPTPEPGSTGTDEAEDLSEPLTLQAQYDDTEVQFTNNAAGPVTYKINGGTAQTIGAGATVTINLNMDDKVEFFGDNKTYTNASGEGSDIICMSACYAYGNVMSLVDSENFATATALEEEAAFYMLFQDGYIENHPTKDILLPATTLTKRCYDDMFERCRLTRAPKLPATTLAESCYKKMFYGCGYLNYVKCLATDISAANCLEDWLLDVPATGGTFVKDASVTFPSGESGIPEGWTVETVE